MDGAFFLSPAEDTATLATDLNEVSARFGLTLSNNDVRELNKAREKALRDNGRVELGDGILRDLVRTFCDSPYILEADFAETLAGLQDYFYYFKNESDDTISDDELIEMMETVFNSRGGSIDNLSYSKLCRLARGEEYEDE